MNTRKHFSISTTTLVYGCWLGFAPLLIMLCAALWPAQAAVPVPSVAAFAGLPLAFEPNHGQAGANTRFLAHGTGYGLALTDTGAELTLRREVSVSRSRASAQVPLNTVVNMTWVGARRNALSHGDQLLPGTSNYFIGQDKSHWHTGIPNFARVRYSQIYPGVDVVYYGNQRRLEYDFVVAPGADPAQILLRFQGVDSLAIDASGDLVLRTQGADIRQHKPVIYQTIGGVRREIAGRYIQVDPGQVKFAVGNYDRRHELVIDPVLAYSTYLGQATDEVANSIAVDTGGNVYIAGTSHQTTDRVFVSKISPAGNSVLYTAYIGDPNCDSFAAAVKVDSGGNAHVTGRYGTVDQWGYCNMKYAFVSKLNAAGNTFVYSQAFGGGGGDHGNEIALDAAGNAYVTGHTDGDWPVTADAFQSQGGFPGDAFILKLAPNGTVLYSTYLGNQTLAEGFGIAVDAQNNIYVTGSTQTATLFPVTANAFQTVGANSVVTCFITKMNAAGSALLYSTYFGGERGEDCAAIAVDAAGKIYVTGTTNSYTFPTTVNAFDRSCGTDGSCNPYQPCPVCSFLYAEDVFVAKFDPLRSGAASLVYSTFIGGENRDLAHAIAVDGAGNCYVAGGTSSLFFPLQSPTQTASGGGHDAFVVQVNPTGSALLWSTYLGGAGWDEVRGMALDAAGSLFVAGRTSSTNFPTRNPLQAANAGSYDSFITKYGAAVPATVSALTLNPATVTSGTNPIATVTLSLAAPVGGMTVTLISSNTAVATVPTSVVVPAGASTATFTVTSRPVTTATAALISATAGGVTKSASLIVQPPVTYALNVSRIGNGAGSITSSPLGINCGTDCTEPYASGTAVTLTASPGANSAFAGWSGACTGTAACTVSMTAAKSITANFVSLLPTVTLSTLSAAKEYGPTAGKFTFTRSGSTAAALDVFFTVTGSATAGTDYVTLPTHIIIPAGAASTSILVTPVDDALVEASETVVLTLSTNAAYVLGATKSGTVTILDNDTTVNIAATTPTASEAGAVPGKITVTRVGYTASALTVYYSVSGTATKGIDYSAPSGSVTIPAGASSATVTIAPIDDAVVEANETVVLTLSANAGYKVGTPASATVTIISDE